MRILYQSPAITVREYADQEEHVFIDLFSNENVTRYLPVRTRQQYVELFWGSLSDYPKALTGRWGIFDTATGDFIGMCLLRPFADFPEQIEIGYSLREEYWGKGIATEMVNALTAYGFENLDTEVIVAVTDLANIGSQKVLLKSGYTQQPNLFRQDESIALAYFKIDRNDR